MDNNRTVSQRDEKQEGIPSWMITFSDLATLLLTFFVLLLSMASMDDKTLKSLFTNFTSACGILNFKEYGEIYRPKEILIEGIYQKLKDTLVIKRIDDQAEIPSEVDETFLEESGGQVIMEDLKDGFKLVFGHKLLFESGRAEIKEEMEPVLEQIGRFINASSFQVYIDGHTDNVPVYGGPYSDNEELSLARAYNIMDYLVNKEGVPPEALALAGYGENHPAHPNDSPSGRANNRRVEMIFKNKTYF